MKGGESVEIGVVPIADMTSYSDIWNKGLLLGTYGPTSQFTRKVASANGGFAALYGVSSASTVYLVVASDIYNTQFALSYGASYSEMFYATTARNSYYVGQYPVTSYGYLRNSPYYYENLDDIYTAFDNEYQIKYPITYHYTNSTVSGPLEAVVGDTVVVSAVPDVDYGIADASSQIIVTNNDIAVPYTWDAANNRITFTMPDPS